jgi:hypothetical protein
MSTRPAEYLNWTTGQPPAVIEAPANLRQNGWGVGVAPPAQYTNWQLWLLDQWVQYLDQITGTGAGINSQILRLINGGYWSFVATSGVLTWSSAANISMPGIPDTNNVIPAGSCTLVEGDIAYVTVNAPFVIVGDISSGSNLVTNVNFTGNLQPGMSITGTGIPSGTTIFAVGSSNLTLTQNATATATQEQLIASSTGNLTVQVIAEEDFIPSFLTIMFAKRLHNIVFVGVNAAEMILRDNEIKPYMGSGYFDTYDVIAGQNLTAGELVYISPGPSLDSGRTVGAIYPLDTSAINQAIRGTYAGTVISTVTTGTTVTVVYNGFFTYSSLIAGETYYSDPTTPGGFTATSPAVSGIAGAKIVPIGFAVTSTLMILAGTGTQTNAVTQPIVKYDFLGNGDGSTVSYSLSNAPLNSSSVFVFVDGLYSPPANWGLSGTTLTFNTAPKEAQSVEAFYILSEQNYLQGFQEVPSFVSAGLYDLAGIPLSKDVLSVYIDGAFLKKDQFSLISGPTISQIELNTPLIDGQDIAVTYLSPIGYSVASNNITGINNLGTGAGLFASISGTIANFKSIKNGTGVTLTDDGSTITISAAGVSGGYVAYGTPLAPLVITASGGITATNDQRQLQFVESAGGVVTITANPQISPGITIGQEMMLQGTSLTNYIVLNNGNGLSLNGPCGLGGPDFQVLGVFWNGQVWREMFRS